MNDGLALGQNEAFAEIVKLLEPFRKGDAEITLDTDITRDLNIDSLAVISPHTGSAPRTSTCATAQCERTSACTA